MNMPPKQTPRGLGLSLGSSYSKCTPLPPPSNWATASASHSPCLSAKALWDGNYKCKWQCQQQFSLCSGNLKCALCCYFLDMHPRTWGLSASQAPVWSPSFFHYLSLAWQSYIPGSWNFDLKNSSLWLLQKNRIILFVVLAFDFLCFAGGSQGKSRPWSFRPTPVWISLPYLLWQYLHLCVVL